MSRVLRVALWLVSLLFFLFVGVSGWVGFRFLATRPQLEGTVVVEGPSGSVTIVRDEHGVPHIYGQTEGDVFFGLGYVHAQERFFQMDMIRRYGAGRLSEMLGSMTLRADRWVRLRGLPRIAEQASEKLPSTVRALSKAYVAGVNARLQRGAPAPEYTLLFFEAEPWTLKDSISVVMYMADDLSSGLSQERNQRRLKDVLTSAQLKSFFPKYPENGPTTIHAEDIAGTSTGTHSVRSGEGEGPGSNAWVVSGARSKTGAPILANDPHLGIGVPSIWYLAHLALPDGDVVGATIPGAPFVVLGRNEDIAWGFTNAEFDVVDLSPVPPRLEVQTRVETIKVRFGEDTQITVRSSEDGPVLAASDLGLEGSGSVILRSPVGPSLAGVVSGMYRIMKARDWSGFVEAGREWTAPMQNMLFASVSGDIGYTTPGLVPVRRESGGWRGFIPYEELPRVLNPKRGLLINANNRVVPPIYPYPLMGDYRYFRARRLEEALPDDRQFSVEDFEKLQGDVESVLAKRLVPMLKAAQPKTRLGEQAQSRLESWDGVLDPNGSEALIFAAWFRAIHPLIYADELGAAYRQYGRLKPVFIDAVLLGEEHAWCDDVRTSTQEETCLDQVSAAFDVAAENLSTILGTSMDEWIWGDVHQAVFAHPIMSKLPLLSDMYTIREPMGGGPTTPNVAGFPPEGAYDVRHAASFRAIYDLSDLDKSKFIHAPGQSGHPLSPHFSDLASLWSEGRYIEIAASALGEVKGRRLVLEPEPTK